MGRAIPRLPPIRVPTSIVQRFADVKAEYAAGMPSRFRRTRTRLGGTADAHYTSNQQFWSVREYARDMDRNDPLIGQLVDRAVANVLQTGLELVPDTGDKETNRKLRDLWLAWAEDPLACDASGRFAFPEIERMVLRHEIVDGDMFVLPLEDGTLQSVEGDRVDSPQKLGGDVIHGVRISPTGKPIEYWFTRDRPYARFAHTINYASPGGFDVRPAFDEDGEPVVLHMFSPSRMSQTRGITAFHAIFDYLGMIEDVNFATLIKQQITSCVAVFIKSKQDTPFGSREEEAQADSTTQILEELSPGMMPRLAPGEDVVGFSPNVPTNEFFTHMRFLLRIVGCNLGLPLELVLLDMSETNFSGHRAAIQQARIGFRLIQQSYPRRFHRPLYRWKARAWLQEMGLDPDAHPELLKHAWRGQGWEYIEPLADAQADKIRVDNMFISRRQLAHEHGEDFDDIRKHAIEGNAEMIAEAQAAAQKLSTDEDPVSWRDVAGLATPAGATTSKIEASPGDEAKRKQEAEAAKAAKEKPAPAKNVSADGEGDVKASEVRALVSESEARVLRSVLDGLRTMTPAPLPPTATVGPTVAITVQGGMTAAMPNGSDLIVHANESTVLPAAVTIESHNHNTFSAPAESIKIDHTTNVESKIAVDAKVQMPARRGQTFVVADADGHETTITATPASS